VQAAVEGVVLITGVSLGRVSGRPLAVWRLRASSIAGLAVLSAGLLVFAIDVFVTDASSGDRPFAIGMLLVPLICMIAVLRLRLTLYDDRAVVRNWVGEEVIRLDDLVAVEPGRSGIRLQRRDGSAVIAESVQKSPLAEWMGRETRADRAALAILRAKDGDQG
jgi:hypothetical protein